MIGPLVACLITVPTPPGHATDTMAAAWEAWQADQAAARWQECADEIHDLNGPYVAPQRRSDAPRAPQPSAPVSSGVEQWRTAVAAYGWPVDQALTVMACESGGDPSAYNPSGATGLFQIKPFWTTAYPGDLWNPGDNIRVAYLIWANEGGWKHWMCHP